MSEPTVPTNAPDEAPSDRVEQFLADFRERLATALEPYIYTNPATGEDLVEVTIVVPLDESGDA